MRFGVIGYGNIARKFVQSIEATDEGVIYAIASHSVSNDDEYLKSHPNVVVYRDYQEVLDDKNVEAIYIALPHYNHKEWILKALEHHKSVLSEKPIVLGSNDVEVIKEKVHQNQGYCLEAFKTKFNLGYESLKKDLTLIGDIQTIDANFCFDATKLGKDSYLFDEKQGGALNDVGTYVIGFILGIANSNIKSLESTIHKKDNIEVSFKTKISFENGIVGIGEGAINYNKERYALIKGTLGEIYIPMFNRIIDYTIKLSSQEIQREYPIIGDDMTLEIQTMIDDVKQGKLESEIHSLDDAKQIQLVIERIRQEATLK